MRARTWLIALVGGLVAPIGAASATASPAGVAALAPAMSVSSVAPTVVAPGTVTNIVITGTDFVNGTFFSSNPPGLVNSATVDSSTQVTINLTAPPVPAPVGLFALAPTPGATPVAIGLVLVRTAEGTFFPVTPVRALDTRSGAGGRFTPVGTNDSYSVSVTGIGDIPSANVSAVVLNVTATNTTASSFVSVYPAGGARPTVSNLNFNANQTVPNHVIVGVGTNGQVTLYNFAGQVDLIVDVVGYYVTASGPRGAAYLPLSAPRFDTRGGTPLQPGGTLNLEFNSVAPYSAVVFNLTVDQPTAPGFITTFPKGVDRPNTSSINFVAGQTVPNLVTSKLGADNAVSIYNGSAGTVHVIVDWIGGYTTSPNVLSSIFRAAAGGPFRLWDSRADLGRPLTAHEVYTVSGASIPLGSVGVVANATVTQPSTGGFATVYPDGMTTPAASSLNFLAGDTRANQVLPAVLPQLTRNIDIYNDALSAHYILDVFGYFQLY